MPADNNKLCIIKGCLKVKYNKRSYCYIHHCEMSKKSLLKSKLRQQLIISAKHRQVMEEPSSEVI